MTTETVSEIAEREAAEAEAEAPEDGDEDGEGEDNGDDGEGEDEAEAEDGEPEASTEQAGDVPAVLESEAEIEARFKKAEQAAARWEKALNTALGPYADDLTRCPLCPDVHRGYVNVNDAGRIPDEIRDVALLFLGMQQPADYRQSPATKACPDCDALGQVKTGSRVPNQETLPCPTCKGHGYVPPPGMGTNGSVAADAAQQLAAADRPEPVRTDEDAFGSPRLLPSGLDNPNYGRMPQYKDPAYP